MKMKHLSVFLIFFIFLGCENPIFQKLTDIDSDKDSYNSYPTTLSVPVIAYDSSTDLLTWSSVNGAISYLLYYGNENNTATMTESEMLPETFYPKKSNYGGFYLSIKAYDNQKKLISDFSNIIFVELSAPEISYDGEYLKWNEVYGATHYHVYCGKDSSISSMTMMSNKYSTGTSAYIYEKNMYYAVRAWNYHQGNGNGAYSAFSNVLYISSSSTSSNSSSSSTTTLSAPIISYNSSTGYLSWNSVSGATSYYIYYGSSSSTSSMTYRTDTSLTKIFVGRDYNGKYYSVRAYNGSYSDYSNIVLIQH